MNLGTSQSYQRPAGTQATLSEFPSYPGSLPQRESFEPATPCLPHRHCDDACPVGDKLEIGLSFLPRVVGRRDGCVNRDRRKRSPLYSRRARNVSPARSAEGSLRGMNSIVCADEREKEVVYG